MKFELKKENKNKDVFFIPPKEWNPLFVFGQIGYQDIMVRKKGELSFCCQCDKSYYNYHGKNDALTGISGEHFTKNNFPIKRVFVIQFK